MNLDISFCYNLKCKNKKCERNINNLAPYARRIKPELSFCKFEECDEYNGGFIDDNRRKAKRNARNNQRI